MREILKILFNLFSERGKIVQLARQDLRNRYAGAALGMVWSVIQPLVMATILWGVFTFAFNAATMRGVPFILWLLVGLAAWNFFSEALMTASGSFQEYSFLVKKIPFGISILPMVKIVSALMMHGIFLLIVIGVALVYGRPVTWHWLQILYYALCLMCLLQGLAWITASFNVFMRDIGYIINVLLQFGFWLTPIFWDPNLLRERYPLALKFLQLNPMVYIVDGYRGSILLGIPFWKNVNGTICFWVISLLFLGLGALVFQRLRPHFADVL